MLIDGILAFIFGLPVLFFVGSPVGAFLMIAFILSMTGATAVFRCESVHLAFIGGLTLAAAGVVVLVMDNDFIIIGLIGLVMAVVSLGLIWIGWEDMRAREQWRKKAKEGPITMTQQPMAYPVAAQPPPFDPGKVDNDPRLPR